MIQARCEKNCQCITTSTATVGLEWESALDVLIGIGRAERPSVTVLDRDRSSRYILQGVRPTSRNRTGKPSNYAQPAKRQPKDRYSNMVCCLTAPDPSPEKDGEHYGLGL